MFEAPSEEKPLGSCDPVASDWVQCLNAAAIASDRLVQELQPRIAAAFAVRDSVALPLRQFWVRSLAEADRRYQALREQECGPLAMSEPHVRRREFEARLICRIDRNLERAKQLRSRYGLD